MKNKAFTFFLALLFTASVAVAQSRQPRTVDTFTKISFRVGGNLYLRQGSPQKVELEGKKEVLDKIETEVSGGKLIIGTHNNKGNWSWHDNDDIKVYITVANIEAISVSGSGNLVAETKLTGGDFHLDVSGSGDLTAEVEATGDINANVSGSGRIDLKGKCRNFDSDVSGSGDVELHAVISEMADFGISGSGKVRASGSANKVKTSLSGSGKVLAAELETDTCDIHISGSGDVEIAVKSSLDANISGSGSVSYKGNPSHVNSHSSGSGHIRKM